MIKLLTGDCIEQLKHIKNNSIDSCVTDPPAGISFMGKEWDHDKGGRDEWIKWMSDVMTEVKRVLKPGAHCFVWALPRTSHWTATALEDAGFQIRDIITHVFGSGFPKSHNIGKAIDKKLGNKREVVGVQKLGGTAATLKGKANRTDWYDQGEGGSYTPEIELTKGTSEWEGWGTALKPASEHWILCRKPLSEKTVADNVLKWGTGGINIDGSRIGTEQIQINKQPLENLSGTGMGQTKNGKWNGESEIVEGRFPANFIHDGSDEVMKEFDKAGKSKSIKGGTMGKSKSTFLEYPRESDRGGFNDEGSAARFFYCSKASGKEKNEGLDDMEDKELSGQVNVNKCGNCGLYFQAGDGRELCKKYLK